MTGSRVRRLGWLLCALVADFRSLPRPFMKQILTLLKDCRGCHRNREAPQEVRDMSSELLLQEPPACMPLQRAA